VTNPILSSVFAEILGSLSRRLNTEWAWPSPEAGFAAFAFRQSGTAGPIPAIHEWPKQDSLIHAPSLAAAGYWIAIGGGDDIEVAWLEGVERLRGREPFASDRQSFAYRPVELLGITVGIAALKGRKPQLVQWITGVLGRAHREHMNDPWSSALTQLAETMFATGARRPLPTGDSASLELLCLAYWDSTRSNVGSYSRELPTRLLQLAATESLGEPDVARAAVLYAALRDAVSKIIEAESERNWPMGVGPRNAETIVISICRKFHICAQQLLTRHEGRETIAIADEYDVQDLMHALLKLHFSDVRAEEVTPSVAGKSGRMDFLLKQERIVVETKMTRKGLDQKKVSDELIIDMRRYLSHPDLGTLVCLVYDPGGFCKSPAALENDLSSSHDRFRTTVIVTPTGL
jgi:hypothetical protein